jgi:hypothetical protein
MSTLWQDLRYSVRLLGKHPGFTLTAVGVLTLGIGVNAGVFGIINGLMIRPLAGADAPGEVVGVFSKEGVGAIRTRPRHPQADRPHQRSGLRHCRRGPATLHRHHSHPRRPSGAADSTRMFVYARAATPQTGDTIVRSVREQLRASDPNLPAIFVKSFRARHDGSAQVWVLRTAAKMFLTLGLAGTFVAVMGLYGVRS